MCISKRTKPVLFCIFLLFCFKLFAQNSNVCKPCEEKKKKVLSIAPTTRVLIIFDASNSMSSKWQNQEKMLIAKELVNKLIDSLIKIPNIQLALRVYGSTTKYPPGDCKDSKLVIPFKKNNASEIKKYINNLKPTGITPIEYSLIQASEDFPDNKTLNNIIIITDGIEECNGDVCKAKQYLESKGIIFKPFIIGIGLSTQKSQSFNCVGKYISSDDGKLFQNISEVLIQQKLNKTTAQVNLLDIAGKPTESNVNITFYDAKKQTYLYNYIHSLNEINNPDTIVVPSHITYHVVAHTIPPAKIENVQLNEGKHNIIPIDAPQGNLLVQREKGNFNFNEKTRIVIRDRKKKQILNVQNLNSTEKYIVGNYELNALTLPRLDIYTEISPAKTQTIGIPSAGELKIQSLEAGDGCILLQKDNQIEWVTNLHKETQQIFYLLPGKYKIVWRAKSLRSSIYTIQKEVEIKPHQSYFIKLY